MELKFVEPVFKNGKELVLVNEKDVASEVKRWENAVAAYFFGHDSTQNPPSFDKFLDDLFVCEWKKYGLVKVYSQGSGVFLLNFETLQGKELALGEGPRFYCASRPLILKPWSPDLSLEMKDLKSVPVWIRLPNLRLHLWSPEALSKIASMVGKPLFTDSLTASRKILFYARICVEVELGKVLPDSVPIEDDKGCSYCQTVEYEWKPTSRCSHCLHVGHSDSCPKRKPTSSCQCCNRPASKNFYFHGNPLVGACPTSSSQAFGSTSFGVCATPAFGSASASLFGSTPCSATASSKLFGSPQSSIAPPRELSEPANAISSSTPAFSSTPTPAFGFAPSGITSACGSTPIAPVDSTSQPTGASAVGSAFETT